MMKNKIKNKIKTFRWYFYFDNNVTNNDKNIAADIFVLIRISKIIANNILFW